MGSGSTLRRLRSSSVSRNGLCLRGWHRLGRATPRMAPRVQAHLPASDHNCKNMIFLLFGGGLRYNDQAITPGAQTERRGDAGPVRSLLDGKDLADQCLATVRPFQEKT